MQSDDAAGKIAYLDLTQARLGDHPGERFLGREPADAFGQVLVGVLVAGHPGA